MVGGEEEVVGRGVGREEGRGSSHGVEVGWWRRCEPRGRRRCGGHGEGGEPLGGRETVRGEGGV